MEAEGVQKRAASWAPAFELDGEMPVRPVGADVVVREVSVWEYREVLQGAQQGRLMLEKNGMWTGKQCEKD